MILEDILKKQLGKWTGITYVILPTKETETIYGILTEFSQDHIIIDAFVRHILNLKAILIVDINTQIIMEVAYGKPPQKEQLT